MIPTYQKTTSAPHSHCFFVWAWHQRARKANVWPKIIEVYISSIFIRKIIVFSEMISTFSLILSPAQKQLQIPLHFFIGVINYNFTPKTTRAGKISNLAIVLSQRFVRFSGFYNADC